MASNDTYEWPVRECSKMNCVERRNKFSIENILRPVETIAVSGSKSNGRFNLHHFPHEEEEEEEREERAHGKDGAQDEEENSFASESSIKGTCNLLDHITRHSSGLDDESAHITFMDPVADALVRQQTYSPEEGRKGAADSIKFTPASQHHQKQEQDHKQHTLCHSHETTHREPGE